MTLELDGRAMVSRAAAHEHLKTRLDLPDHYGRNLDALYDLLSECGTGTKIRLTHTDAMAAALGPYADALLDTLRDAANNNPNLEFTAE